MIHSDIWCGLSKDICSGFQDEYSQNFVIIDRKL